MSEKFIKYSKGKVRINLVPSLGLCEAAQALEYGARKYSPDNWDKCQDPLEYWNAVKRHIEQHNNHLQRGTCALDEESGLDHLAHAAASLLIYIELRLMQQGTLAVNYTYRGNEPKPKEENRVFVAESQWQEYGPPSRKSYRLCCCAYRKDSGITGHAYYCPCSDDGAS